MAFIVFMVDYKEYRKTLISIHSSIKKYVMIKVLYCINWTAVGSLASVFGLIITLAYTIVT